jgi:hypothetical protein
MFRGVGRILISRIHLAKDKSLINTSLFYPVSISSNRAYMLKLFWELLEKEWLYI